MHGIALTYLMDDKDMKSVGELGRKRRVKGVNDRYD
jgi:hypothetical protein